MDISSRSDKIYSYEFSNNTKFVDSLMKDWKIELKQKIKDLKKDKIDIITSDSCMCKSLSNRNFFTRSNICKGCSILNRLNYNFYLPSSNEIKIECGEYKGTCLRLYSHKNTDISIKTGENRVFTNNPFVNYTLISSILHNITQEKKYPYYVPYVWSYICNDTFNIILNMNYMKTLREIALNPILSKNSPLAKKSIINSLSEKIVKDIFIQLTLMMFFLSKYEFSHGEPSLNYITFSPHGCNFIFQKINVISKIGLLVCPSSKSSITYKKERVFYSKNNIIHTTDVFENRDVSLDNKNYTGDYQNHRVIYNKIGNKFKNFIDLYCNEGKYVKSFDFVMFFTSLVADPSYFDSFKDQTNLMYTWKSIWRQEDYESLMKDLQKVRKNSFMNIFDIVKKYYFREDALEFSLKTLYDL